MLPIAGEQVRANGQYPFFAVQQQGQWAGDDYKLHLPALRIGAGTIGLARLQPPLPGFHFAHRPDAGQQRTGSPVLPFPSQPSRLLGRWTLRVGDQLRQAGAEHNT